MTTSHNHQNCIKHAIHHVEKICRDKKLRFTALRQKVLEIIWESHAPTKAYDILNKLKTEETTPKPPIVYRTLDFLLEHGFIHKLNSLNAYTGCSHPLAHKACYFLICNDCGEVKECCNDDLATTITHTASLNHFKVGLVTLEIAGKCNPCRNI